jgi:exonuclease VII small subunit
MGGYNAGAENESTLQKQIKILENRLDKANQKFNEAIAVNRELRQVIDSLRRERVIFDNLYKKLEKELHEKRKEMANIIEKANTAY